MQSISASAARARSRRSTLQKYARYRRPVVETWRTQAGARLVGVPIPDAHKCTISANPSPPALSSSRSEDPRGLWRETIMIPWTTPSKEARKSARDSRSNDKTSSPTHCLAWPWDDAPSGGPDHQLSAYEVICAECCPPRPAQWTSGDIRHHRRTLDQLEIGPYQYRQRRFSRSL